MLKRTILCSSVLVLAAIPAQAQNPRAEVKATVAGKSVSVEYGRPSLKGRDMLSQAEIGQAWRMGAEGATTLKTDADLSFGTATVPKGTYVLKATKVAVDKWNLNIIKDDKSVADVPLTSGKLPASVEMFTIEVKGDKDKGVIDLHWGTTSLKTSFTAK